MTFLPKLSKIVKFSPWTISYDANFFFSSDVFPRFETLVLNCKHVLSHKWVYVRIYVVFIPFVHSQVAFCCLFFSLFSTPHFLSRPSLAAASSRAHIDTRPLCATSPALPPKICPPCPCVLSISNFVSNHFILWLENLTLSLGRFQNTTSALVKISSVHHILG